MKLLVKFKTSSKPIDVNDKSDVEVAVKEKFKNEIRNRPFKIQYYSEDFEDFMDLEDADIENHGKLRVIVDDCIDTGTASLAQGEQVYQEIKDSSVSVVAGNQTLNIYKGENQTKQEINYKELIKTVNDNTKEIIRHSILTDFKHEKLNESGCVVHPQMVEIDVNSYYKGDLGMVFTRDTSCYSMSRNEIQRDQFLKEGGFYRPHPNKNEEIEVNNFMESISTREELDSDDVIGVTAIVASAGSGKTTLTRRMARKALDILTTDNENGNDFPKREMVHYIELKDIQEDENWYITPSKFLFHGIACESEQQQVFKWLVKNQSAVILFFDGLDQTRWDFSEKSWRRIRNDQSASPSTIMYNILARNILRHVKIFIASREFKVSELPSMAQPERVVALNGFTLEDAKTLFISVLEENGRDLWEKIEAMSPRLLQLVCVPVFLILTAIVMGRDPDKDPPSTVTELYNRIVLNLENVKNIRNEQILMIIKKLKKMAYRGMREGRVVFKETDLKEHGVLACEVEDLMSKIPGNKLVSCRLLPKDFNFFFCHQSMQEFLAASFVAEMNLDDFYRFDKEHLHGKRWSVVRRFVSGIVFSKSANELHNGQHHHSTC